MSTNRVRPDARDHRSNAGGDRAASRRSRCRPEAAALRARRGGSGQGARPQPADRHLERARLRRSHREVEIGRRRHAQAGPARPAVHRRDRLQVRRRSAPGGQGQPQGAAPHAACAGTAVGVEPDGRHQGSPRQRRAHGFPVRHAQGDTLGAGLRARRPAGAARADRGRRPRAAVRAHALCGQLPRGREDLLSWSRCTCSSGRGPRSASPSSRP